MDVQQDIRLIMRAIKQAHNAIKSHLVREWIPQRLTVTQFQALQHLSWYSDSEGMTIGELAEHLGLAYSTISNLVDRLESRGWVRRQRNPSDQRRIHILLTEQTKKLFEENRERAERFGSETIGRLSREERQMLLQGLNRLIAVMESPHWPDYESFHPAVKDSERQRFLSALDGWIDAKIGMIGKMYVLAAFAEEQHDYELTGYLKQAAHDLIGHIRELWVYIQDPPDLKLILEGMKVQRSIARDAALEAWRFADILEDQRFAELIDRTRQDVRKHIQWFHQVLKRYEEGSEL